VEVGTASYIMRAIFIFVENQKLPFTPAPLITRFIEIFPWNNVSGILYPELSVNQIDICDILPVVAGVGNCKVLCHAITEFGAVPPSGNEYNI
jgi:hypothetical protein